MILREGIPIAVQLRETELGMTTETGVTGFTVMSGITANYIWNRTIIYCYVNYYLLTVNS